MNSTYYLDQSFNEVVFRSRNKLYGAFNLRSTYRDNIIKAFIVATTVALMLLIAPIILGNDKSAVMNATENKPTDEGYVLRDIPIAKPKVEQLVTPSSSKQKVKTVTYSVPKVVKNNSESNNKEIASIEELKGAQVGVETIEGESIKAYEIGLNAPTGLETGTAHSESTEPFIYVEEMPSYAEGEQELMRYIGRKLKYPAQAQRAGVEGIVVITFVVSPTGKISDAEVVKGIGYGADEEAVRVIKSMPDWKPGKQNGKPVAVRFTLPIRFSLN